MRILEGAEEVEAIGFLEQAVEIAQKASCQRSRCGSVIVKNGKLIGSGWNSPPGNLETQRRCSCEKTSCHPKVTDKTCCVHAEQRALFDALIKDPEKLKGSRLYFIRLDENNNISRAGQPYCTICSKMTLDLGVVEFVLWHEDGIGVYDTQEYNKRSYEYGG